MPAGKPTIASNTQAGGHAQPQSRQDVRRAAAHSFGRYANIAPLVLQELPDHGAPAIGAAEIHKRLDCYSRDSVRNILRFMVKDGIAASTLVFVKRGSTARKVYTKAPNADDFENCKLVYGDAAE